MGEEQVFLDREDYGLTFRLLTAEERAVTDIYRRDRPKIRVDVRALFDAAKIPNGQWGEVRVRLEQFDVWPDGEPMYEIEMSARPMRDGEVAAP